MSFPKPKQRSQQTDNQMRKCQRKQARTRRRKEGLTTASTFRVLRCKLQCLGVARRHLLASLFCEGQARSLAQPAAGLRRQARITLLLLAVCRSFGLCCCSGKTGPQAPKSLACDCLRGLFIKYLWLCRNAKALLFCALAFSALRLPRSCFWWRARPCPRFCAWPFGLGYPLCV